MFTKCLGLYGSLKPSNLLRTTLVERFNHFLNINCIIKDASNLHLHVSIDFKWIVMSQV